MGLHGGQINQIMRSLQNPYPRKRKKKRVSNEDSSKESSKLSKLKDDIALVKSFIRTQSGGLETPLESPLSEEIEHAKINRDLKVPPIELFDGSSDPSDFINVFDGRMSFFGHSEVARCRFFSTCLKGTALHWFNNLTPHSIESWSILNPSSTRGSRATKRKVS